MELHQVRYFLALCEENNFTRAAKRCGVSQPSLSNGIKTLEKELGGPLFQRNRVNCCLSALGQAVRPHFIKLDQCVTDAHRQAEQFLTVPRDATAALETVLLISSPEQRQERFSSRMPPELAFRGVATKGAFMRAHHVLTVAAAILVGLGVKLFFFAAPTAEAVSLPIKSAGVDVSQLHHNVKDLPTEEFHDMTFVFSSGG